MRRSEGEQLSAQVAGRGEVFAAGVGDQAAVFAEDRVALGRFAADLAVDGCEIERQLPEQQEGEAVKRTFARGDLDERVWVRKVVRVDGRERRRLCVGMVKEAQ